MQPMSGVLGGQFALFDPASYDDPRVQEGQLRELQKPKPRLHSHPIVEYRRWEEEPEETAISVVRNGEFEEAPDIMRGAFGVEAFIAGRKVGEMELRLPEDSFTMEGFAAEHGVYDPASPAVNVRPPVKGVSSEIEALHVLPEHRRQGIAHHMLRQARAWWPERDIRHSPILSEEGLAFAGSHPEARFPRSAYYGHLRDVIQPTLWGDREP